MSNKEMAAFGLTPTDFETTSLSELAAAAKAFEDALNSAPGLIEAGIGCTEWTVFGQEPKNHFTVSVRQVKKVR